jgi:hypothetical protein
MSQHILTCLRVDVKNSPRIDSISLPYDILILFDEIEETDG